MKLKKAGAFGLAVLLALNAALLTEPFTNARKKDTGTVYAANNEEIIQFDDLSMTADFGAKTPTTSLSGDFEITYTGHAVGGDFANAPLVEFRDADNNCIDLRFDDWGWTYTGAAGVVDFTAEQKSIALWPSGGWPEVNAARTTGIDFTAKIVREGTLFKAEFTEKLSGAEPHVKWTYTVDFPAMAKDTTVLLTGGGKVDISDIKLSVILVKDDPDTPNPDTPSSEIGDYTGADYAAVTPGHVTVHDPSIVYDDKNDTYYIFGSHMAWAKSKDMIHWQTFTNNINRDYASIFAEDAEWSKRGSADYDVSGNLWAPDVIWNPEMGKWCMYMSVNGDHWYTSVVLLTADSLDGDWTRVGPVVYSGFTNAEEAAATDYAKVIGSNDVASRYLENRNGNHTYGMNAIDPCVLYDDDGNLWMAYGSWFGGIYMLKLDNASGLRDYNETYALAANASDPYQGIKLAGGAHCSGEAAYIQKVGNYYYLYVTYGGLTARGGYNMRVFRSEDIKGPYVDVSGDSARYTAGTDNINGSVGNRVMSGYKWSYMNIGFVAQGHNSAFVGADGRSYLIYHTRFNDGTEGHQVRVHQTFVNEDGWLVTAPFEYTGERLLKGFSQSDVAGVYEVLFHKLNIDYAGLEVVGGETLNFGEDGTISGTKTGTWSFSSKGAPYVTMTIGGVTYKGVFLRQQMEDSQEMTWTFTVLGSDEISVWGYRYPGDDAQQVMSAAESLAMPEGTFINLQLPSTGLYDSVITWESSNEAVLASDGTVTPQEQDTVVTMTATFKVNDAVAKKDYRIKVYSAPVSGENKVLASYFTGEKVNLTSVGKGTYQFANPFYKDTTKGLAMYNGVSISFDLEATQGADQWLSDIITFNAGEKGGLFFEGNSYLGYNGPGGIFDANLKNGTFTGQTWQWGKNFIGNGAHVEIQMLPDGFAVYVNGKLAYDQDTIEPYESGKTNYTVPGQISLSSYTEVLNYLQSSAKYLNFGWGSYWDGGYKGTISNVVISAMPIEVVDTSSYAYYQDFTSLIGKTGAGTGWVSPNASDKLSVIQDNSSAHGAYLEFADPKANGERGAYTVFPVEAQLSTDFTAEADIILNSGGDRDTTFAITDKDHTSNNVNNDIATGYFLKLTVKSKTTDCVVAQVGAESYSFTLPKDTWIHVKVYVDESGNVTATVGDQVLTGTSTAGSALGGMYLRNGRSGAYSAIDNIAVRKHNWDAEPVRENEIAPSCTADGSYDEVLYCPACNEELSRNTTTIKKLEHVYNDGIITTNPTCTQEGVKTYTCQREGCGDSYTEAIEALGHYYDDGVITTNPTCTEAGVKTYTCQRKDCGDSYTEAVEALGHSYNDGVITTNPTCTEAGVKTYTCQREGCTDAYTEAIEALGHLYDDGVITTEPTCTEAGAKTYTCQRGCGSTSVEEIPAKGHTPAEAVREKELAADCEKAGSYEEAVYCSVCQTEISRTTKTIEALGHKYGEPIYTWNADNSVTAAFICSVCQKEETVAASVDISSIDSITTYRATVTFAGKEYTTTKRIIALEKDQNMRVVVVDDVKEFPKALTDLGLDSKEKIVEKMIKSVLEKAASDTSLENRGFDIAKSAFFEVTLQILTQDNKWEEVTVENFPKEGIDILVPYPEGTNAKDFDFVVTHMCTIDINGRKAGDVEVLNAVKAEQGLTCRVTSLSPIMISWVPVVENTDTSASEPDTSSDTQSNTQPGTELDTASGTNSSDSPLTADNALPIWVMLCGVAGFGLAAVSRKKCRAAK